MKPNDRIFATPRRIKLRDGRDITIRLLEKTDGEGFVAFYGDIPPEDNVYYMGPNATTPDRARARAEKADDPFQVCLVLADDEGGIHGEAWYSWNDTDRKDKSMFGIAIRRTMQGVGAGRLIMSRLMEVGDGYGPAVMDLTAQIENFRAWKLYTSLGFDIKRTQMRPARPDCPAMPEFYMERVMGRRLRAGAARRVVNPAGGTHLMGQLHLRPMQSVRDDLELNIVYLANRQTALCLVSIDNAACTDALNAALRDAVARETGVQPDMVFITSSHTHTGAEVCGLLHDSPPDANYLALLERAAAEAAREALASVCPALAGSATGSAHIGFNRRLCWTDGTHSMYGDAKRKEFTGIEGPDDPTHTVLLVTDEERKPLAIVHNNCSHTTCVEGDVFASADFPGEARRLIREALVRTDLPVLYLQGASGDTSPWNMLNTPTRYAGETRLREMGAALAAETLRLLRTITPVADPVLRVETSAPVMDVRLPSDTDLAAARKTKADGEEAASRWKYVIDVDGVLRLWNEYHENPKESIPLAAIRIGDLAIATNPFELYCQFGLDIRRRSPAAHTMISQLTGPYRGYLPTIYGILGGGYSGQAIYWARMEPFAGYRVVDETARLLHAAFAPTR